MEYLLEMWPLLAVLIAGVGFVMWWRWRKRHQQRLGHAEALAQLAAGLGGVVAGPDNAAPWSNRLLPAFKNNTGGVINAMTTIGLQGTRFEHALEFFRGRWRVRVTEASMDRRTPTGPGRYDTFYEHRVEVATSQLPPIRICRVLRGIEPSPEPPASVAERQGQWQRLPLRGPADERVAVFANDLSAANRMINHEVLEYLVANAGALPLTLTFESGLVYGTMLNEIDPGTLITTVDTLVGLLDRIPGAAPQ